MNFCRRAISRLGRIALVFALAVGARASAQAATANVAQQVVFAGLRSVGAKGQINALATDAAGDVYLAFDQGDGVRVLKVANDGGALLAQVQLGASGDSAVALALDTSGNVYIAGTSTSGSLSATSGAAVGAATAGTTNSFVAKFDANLSERFLTFTGGTRIAASAVAASGDRVFVTGITYAADLPVSATAIEQAPALGSFQNGFVESFSADGTTLEYATYVTGAEGDTTPTGVAVDAGDDAYLVGSTSASGFPAIAAVVSELLSTPSGFLLQLTPAGDGIVYSTFVPGAGLSSVALDSTGLSLLVSGQVALGQFPVDTVTSPLVPTAYQVLLRLSLDGSTVESGTVIAPSQQSVVTAGGGGTAWVGGSFTPGAAPLLPQPSLSSIGNAYTVRVAPAVGIDETIRFGGLANLDQAYASVPVGINGVAADATSALFAGGFAQPTASASLLASETYDFPLRAGATAALPSMIADAEITSAVCGGSLCSGSAAYLTKVDVADSGPALAFSAGGAPLVTLRNLGSVSAQGLQVTTNAGTLTTTCGSVLEPGAECDVLLAGGDAGTLTASASNGGSTAVAFGPYSGAGANSGLVFAPKELDFGIQTSASPEALRTITVSNLGSTAATFTEGIVGTPESSTPFTELSSTCPLAGPSAQKVLAAGKSCTITVGFNAFTGSSNDGFIQAEWTIASADVFLTGYSQSASLSVSAGEIDFGTEIQGGLAFPRYLFLSNASASAQSHTPVTLPANSPFTITDGCSESMAPGTVCRLQINYLSSTSPSSDSLTLTLDEGLAVLLTGKTTPKQTLGGSTVSPSLTASPAAVTFGDAVVVTGISSATQAVSITNSGAATVALTMGVTGDFSGVSGCAGLLAAGASCAVAITFTPSQPGVRQGLLTVSAGEGTSPLTVSLAGTGTAILSANNGALAFAATPVGQPLVQSYRVTEPFDSLSVQATGPYLVTLVEDTGFGFGEPPSSAYVANGSGTCHNCWVGVQFKPASAGPQTGTLSFTSAPTGIPYVLQLTGSGIATTGLIVSPSVNVFGTVPVTSVSGPALVTLTNLSTSGAAIDVTAVTTSSNFTIDSSGEGSFGCSGNLPYAASCSMLVQFAPTAIGITTGSLNIDTSAGTASASLAGTGTTAAGVAITPLSLTFADTPGVVGQTQSVSVKNTGTQAITVGTPATTTTSFALSNGCSTLAAGESCTINVGFTAAALPMTDTLSIPVSTAGSGGAQTTQTYGVSLSGSYTVQSQGIAVFPESVAFGPVTTGTLGSTREIAVTNLATKKVDLSVSMPRSFVLLADTCTTLTANASCVLTIAFVPLENGDLPGTISVTATATDGSESNTVLVYADGYGLGTGTLSISGGLIVDGVFNFGSVGAGQSVSQQFELENQGAQAVTVRRIVSQPPFVSTTTCGSLLQPGSSCAVTIQYNPGSGGSSGSETSADMGTLTVESDAQSSPNLLDLEGQPSTTTGAAGAAPVASLSLSEGTISFGATAVGDVSASQILVLTNTGTTVLQVTTVSTTTDFAVHNGCTAVASGSSCTIVVSSSPQSTGTHIASLEIASNLADSLEYVTLVSVGVTSSLVVSPVSLEFGSVLVGNSSALPLQVTNSGSSSITFTTITAGANLNVAGDCPTGGGSLPAQATCTEQVTFQPSAAGAFSGTIGFNTSATSGPILVPVSGTGATAELTASPASLSFGSVVLGGSSSLTINLANQGTVAVVGLNFAVTGNYAATTTCTQAMIPAGTSCTIQVTFTPTAIGARVGTLTISNSDPGSPVAVALNGNGIASPTFVLTVNGGVSETVTVASGGLATFPLLVTPSGGFAGGIVLTCTPVQTVAYAICALLPSQVILGPGAESSTATINTEESNSAAALLPRTVRIHSEKTFLTFLLPGVLLIFRRGRSLRRWIGQGLAIGALVFALQLSGCGSSTVGTPVGSGIPESYTPPGQYQFQVSASSTGGVALTRTVTLNLVVTARE